MEVKTAVAEGYSFADLRRAQGYPVEPALCKVSGHAACPPSASLLAQKAREAIRMRPFKAQAQCCALCSVSCFGAEADQVLL